MNSQLLNKNIMTGKHSLIFVFLMVFLFTSHSILAQKKQFIVVLDAGHGGKDPGKVDRNNGKEKEIAKPKASDKPERLDKAKPAEKAKPGHKGVAGKQDKKEARPAAKGLAKKKPR